MLAFQCATSAKPLEQKIEAPAGQRFEYVLHDACIASVELSGCHGPAPDALHCEHIVIKLPDGKKVDDCLDIHIYRVPAETITVPGKE